MRPANYPQGTPGRGACIHTTERGKKLLVVQVGEEQLLLSVAAGRIEKLHVLKSPVGAEQNGAATDGADAATDFGARLRELMAGRGASA